MINKYVFYLTFLIISGIFANDLLNKAKVHYNLQEYETAKTILEQVLDNNDEDAVALHWMGRTLIRLGALDDAVDFLEEATEYAPDSANYHFWYGQTLGQNMSNASVLTQALSAHKVLDAFEKTIELDPKHIGGHMGAANYYLQAPGIVGGDLDKARKEAEILIELGSSQGRFILISVLEQEGKTSEAEQAYLEFDKAFNDSTDNWSFYNNYGYFLLRQKRYEESIEKFKRQVELAQNQANPHDSLGDAYRAAGKLKRAIAEYKKALAIDPGFKVSKEKIDELEEELSEKKD